MISFSDGVIGILAPDLADEACAVQLRKMVRMFGDRAYVSLCLRLRPNDQIGWTSFPTLQPGSG